MAALCEKDIRRVVRGVLAVVALGVAAYEYSAAGFTGFAGMMSFLGSLLAFQAATGQG